MNFAKTPGMYVLSFNMERPMVYYQYQPQSKRYVDSNMIKVGKCKNIKTRMGNYVKTYGMCLLMVKWFQKKDMKKFLIKKEFLLVRVIIKTE